MRSRGHSARQKDRQEEKKGDAAIMKHRRSATGSAVIERETCARCRGLMVPSFTDSLLLEIAEKSGAASWRCVNCGEWIDATIVTNRKSAGRPGGGAFSSLPPFSRRRWRW